MSFDIDTLIHKNRRSNYKYPECNHTTHDPSNPVLLRCRNHPMDLDPKDIPVDRMQGHGNQDHRGNRRVSWHPKLRCTSYPLASPTVSRASKYHDRCSSRDKLSVDRPPRRNPGSNYINPFFDRTNLDLSTLPMDASRWRSRHYLPKQYPWDKCVRNNRDQSIQVHPSTLYNICNCNFSHKFRALSSHFHTDHLDGDVYDCLEQPCPMIGPHKRELTMVMLMVGWSG